jgi:hypothetical protein
VCIDESVQGQIPTITTPANVTESATITSLITVSYNLFSDNELGQIGTTCALCAFLTEDGTFQQLANNSITTSLIGTVNVFLKSDVEVPEPASLVLFGSALIGFGAMRRRRGWRRRNYEFTA